MLKFEVGLALNSLLMIACGTIIRRRGRGWESFFGSDQWHASSIEIGDQDGRIQEAMKRAETERVLLSKVQEARAQVAEEEPEVYAFKVGRKH